MVSMFFKQLNKASSSSTNYSGNTDEVGGRPLAFLSKCPLGYFLGTARQLFPCRASLPASDSNVVVTVSGDLLSPDGYR